MDNKASFFTRYDQKENRTTNYCLLMLNQVYNYSPLLFNKLLMKFTSGEEIDFGVNIIQQKGIAIKKGKQIADGIIVQEPITIYVETKNFDWFYDDQIKGYLDNLSRCIGKRILLLLSNVEDEKKLKERADQLLENYNDISIYIVNFYDLYKEIEQLSNDIHNDMFSNMLNDFEEYLIRENLIPIWKYRLDIVKTGFSMDVNLSNNCYSCPLQDGTYWHRRSKYMGLLKDGKVLKFLFEIDGVVDVTKTAIGNCYEVEYNNINDEKKLKDRAEKILQNKDYYGQKDLNKNVGLRLFILSNKRELTEGFTKDSLGGRLPGKMYINLAKNWNNRPESIDEVVNLIDGKKWSEFQ